MALAVPRSGPTWEYTLFLTHEETPSLSLTLAAEAPRSLAQWPSPSVLGSPPRLVASTAPRSPAWPPPRLDGSPQRSNPALRPPSPRAARRSPQPRLAARRSGLGSRRPPARPPAGSARHRPPAPPLRKASRWPKLHGVATKLKQKGEKKGTRKRVGVDDDKFGYEAFTKFGFKQWKNAYLALPKHVGGSNSAHNRARAAFDDFDNQRASVKKKVIVHTEDAKKKYETRVETSLAIVSYIALQGKPFRGHDESETSLNKGNFLELLWFKVRNEEVRQAYECCNKNSKMTSRTIQKELAECCAQAVTKVIKEEMSGCLFSILVDESRDISVKEQMAIIVRYVNKKGQVVERFLGIKHLKLTTSEALKRAMVEVLSAYGLTIAKIRGQGYGGAFNMRDFFDYVNMMVSSTSASCRRKDLLVDNHHTIISNKLESGEISSGRGQHQETSLSRPGDKRWGSHYKTLLRIETM
ncbi:hypothetical protein U9M48_034965 [Paspalum notatum var. saurae]|uniref:DUF4371 domain-containing protein n=1 Tax=Paspalum notatum var. saurae TaxID=547442 RepID=A0AAQ3UEB7_PASNO